VAATDSADGVVAVAVKPGVSVKDRVSPKAQIKLFGVLKEVDNYSMIVGYTDPETAKIAAINEYGTDTIPERPFMRRAIEVTSNEVGRVAGMALDEAVGDEASIVASMTRVAGAMQGAVLESLATTSTWATPNADSTMDEKGYSDSPLHAGHERFERDLIYQIRKGASVIASGGVIAGERAR
jgi:hypothetical protein